MPQPDSGEIGDRKSGGGDKGSIDSVYQLIFGGTATARTGSRCHIRKIAGKGIEVHHGHSKLRLIRIQCGPLRSGDGTSPASTSSIIIFCHCNDND